ncbi:MAG: alanine racemase [Deltaproteobacteria bacterium]|nr:alanine racemase [Deltaproteobacteria bacterium]
MIHPHYNVRIDTSSLVFNLGQVKRLVGPDVKIMGIVKSDAYGHGLAEVSRVLERNGIYSLGTAFIHEALKLREIGIRAPVIVLCGIGSTEEAMAAVENDLTPVIFDMPSAALLALAAEKRSKRTKIQVKIDTGMGRLGVNHKDAVAFLNEIARFSWLNIEGLMSHLSSADGDAGFTESQIRNFSNSIDAARETGMDLRLNSLANSAGVMNHKASYFDMVRPGIMLYGGLPSPGFAPPLELKPVMRFSARILQIREMPDKTPISYGRRYYTDGVKRIAVISAGYGDGIPRSLTNKGRVIIKGQKADIVGTVCMNLTLCDVTAIKDAAAEDEAVFLGRQGQEIISGDDIASLNDTISYEIFISIGKGVNKEYIG